MFGIEGVFRYSLFGDSVVGSIIYMFFELGLEESTSLFYVIFSIGAGNLENPWAKNSVGFVFSKLKKLFEGVIGI
jgi:hypothetical protein